MYTKCKEKKKEKMINLKNDYCYIAHHKILEKMMALENEANPGYGEDKHSENAKRIILKLVDNPNSDVHFLVGGTITNKVFISHVLKPYEAVISCDSGHINVHETGTIEESGHKILLVPNKEGKIKIDSLKEVLSKHTDCHMVKPKLVYISNPSEYGTIYSLKELEELSSFCKENHLFFYVDGARLASALTCDQNDISLKDLGRLTDAFYIGGTKNGAVLSEALVINNPSLNEEFRYSIKHFGGMYAKGFVAGIQFETLFEEDLFFSIAKKQNELAKELTNGLKELNVKLFVESPTNQVFCIFKEIEAKRIMNKVDCEIFEKQKDFVVLRFVVNYLNTNIDIDETLKVVKNSLI